MVLFDILKLINKYVFLLILVTGSNFAMNEKKYDVIVSQKNTLSNDNSYKVIVTNKDTKHIQEFRFKEHILNAYCDHRNIINIILTGGKKVTIDPTNPSKLTC